MYTCLTDIEINVKYKRKKCLFLNAILIYTILENAFGFVLFCFVCCFALLCFALRCSVVVLFEMNSVAIYNMWFVFQFRRYSIDVMKCRENNTLTHTQNTEEKKSVIATLQMWVQHVWLITYKIRKEIIHCEITYDNPWYTNRSGCINKHQNTQQLSCRHNLSLIADRSV